MGKMKVKSGKWKVVAALLFLSAIFLTGCHKDDEYIYQDSRRWVEKTVVVVAPTSDPIMKARLERTANWMLQSLHNAQLHDTLCIDLKLEWHDELIEDMATLGEELASSDPLTTTAPTALPPIAKEQASHSSYLRPPASRSSAVSPSPAPVMVNSLSCGRLRRPTSHSRR